MKPDTSNPHSETRLSSGGKFKVRAMTSPTTVPEDGVVKQHVRRIQEMVEYLDAMAQGHIIQGGRNLYVDDLRALLAANATQTTRADQAELELETLAAWAAEARVDIARMASTNADLERKLEHAREQAENIMATTAGCASAEGDPHGALQMVHSMASEIAVLKVIST